MGNTKYVKEYIDRPVEAQIIFRESPQLQDRLKMIDAELKKYKDVKNFRSIVQDLKLSFLNDLPNLKIEIGKNHDSEQWHVGFTGRTSAGKSSLLNKIYGSQLKWKLKVALGKCTIEPQIVLEKGKLRVWDVQGFDTTFDFTGQALSFLNSLDTVCVLYEHN